MSSASTNNQNDTPRLNSRSRRQRSSEPSSAQTTLDSIQRELEATLAAGLNQSEMLQSIVDIVCRCTNAIWSGHFSLNSNRPLACTAENNAIADRNLGLSKSSLLPSAQASIESASPNVTTLGELTVISTPIYRATPESSIAECLSLALNLGTESAASFLLILQLAATYVAKWHEQQHRQNLNWKIDAVAAIADLTSEVTSPENEKHPEIVAANRLATFLKAETVAIGYVVKQGSMRNRFVAVSGSTEVKLESRLSQDVTSALNECLVRDEVTTLPPRDDNDRCMTLAHRSLLERHPDCSLVTAPLKTHEGKTIGAWLCIFPAGNSHQSHSLNFAITVSSYLADALDVTNRAAEGPIARVKRRSLEFSRGNAAKVTAAILLFAALILAIPITHRVDCSCVLKPDKRQFAVAPHNGILSESFVSPGDIVSAGQLLARMDDKELQLEKVDLVAQRQAVIKQRDVNRSASDPAATKIAEMKVRQLDAKLQLVNYRLDHLDIKATSDGVVLKGDLEDAHGAPLRTGDVLMEIAALEQLELEVEVPASQIAWLKTDQSVDIVLDGNPFESFEGTVSRIRPESEVREHENVFVAEVRLDNPDQLLRPGMKGRAKVKEGLRPIGWILFHRPCERVYSIFR